MDDQLVCSVIYCATTHACDHVLVISLLSVSLCRSKGGMNVAIQCVVSNVSSLRRKLRLQI